MAIAAASVIAAAAIVVVGGSALHLNKRGDAAAIIGRKPDVTTMTTQSTTTPAVSERIHIQLSSTDHREDTLAEQVRKLVDSPRPALDSRGGDAGSVGPLGTESGLHACLEAASFAGKDRYIVDLAAYAGSRRQSSPGAWARRRRSSSSSVTAAPVMSGCSSTPLGSPERAHGAGTASA